VKIRLIVLFILCSQLSGCAQKSAHNFHDQNKIPIDPKRWYQLNHTERGLECLFNNYEYDNVNTGWGLILKNYDAYYPVLPGEKISIDSIKMFDGEGTNEDRPMTIYAILKNWQRVPLAVFKGSRYNTWVGPDPQHPELFSLVHPVDDIQFLVINTSSKFPNELEFYGKYAPPSPKVTQPTVNYAPLKNFCGINAFEWDFEAPTRSDMLDSNRLNVIKNFKGFRHYMDWQKLEAEEGTYAFNPTNNGSWNYDTIYQWCKNQNITVLACLKTIPEWMEHTYPEAERNNENTPMRYGKNPSEPASYIEQARAGFQFAARYGSNKHIDPKLIPLKKDNQLRIGLNTVEYIECDNERDKWWKGRKAYQTGREYAANLSAFYDGDQHKLGQGVGVKTADSNMKVVMAGLAAPTTEYVRGMVDWCKEFRGYKSDGSVNLAWDVINYHYYANDASIDPTAQQTTGIAPELAGTAACAATFIAVASNCCKGMPVWVTEAGYDINEGSIQRAPAIKKRTAEETQADWTLRTSLLYAATGVQQLFFYELTDDNPHNIVKYATSGLTENGNTRPAADFLRQTEQLFGEFRFERNISMKPLVNEFSCNTKKMFSLVMPTVNGATQLYALDAGAASEIFVYTPAAGKKNMTVTRQKVANGKTFVLVSETPVFVTTERIDAR
jgi:endoglucanase